LRVILAAEGDELVLRLRSEAAGTLVSGGLFAGRGLSAGFFVSDIDTFLNADALNVNTPIGGGSAFFDPAGELRGVSLGGPSVGLGATFVGPSVGSPAAGGGFEAFRIEINVSPPIIDPITGAPIHSFVPLGF